MLKCPGQMVSRRQKKLKGSLPGQCTGIPGRAVRPSRNPQKGTVPRYANTWKDNSPAGNLYTFGGVFGMLFELLELFSNCVGVRPGTALRYYPSIKARASSSELALYILFMILSSTSSSLIFLTCCCNSCEASPNLTSRYMQMAS